MRAKASCPKTYTLPTQDVYVLLARRIPFGQQGYTSSDSAVEVTLSQRKICLSSSKNIHPLPKLLPRGISTPHLAPTKSNIRSDVVASDIAFNLFLDHLPEGRRSQEAIKDNSIYRIRSLGQQPSKSYYTMNPFSLFCSFCVRCLAT